MDRIGLIAGNGKLPEMFIEQCIRQGIEPVSIYLFDSVEESVKKHVNSAKYSIAQPGKIISYFKKNNISRLVMLGKVEKDLIFSNLKFDFTATKILFSARNKKDKNILKAIIDYIEGEGITVLPQNYLFDEYMVKNENYTKNIPAKNEEKTIEIGIEAARMLTDIDAGQTVVVKDESVVKTARRKQDYRIDIPTIGLETVKKVVEINGRGIIAEAEKMLFIDQKEVIEFANKNKIFIKGIKIND